MRVLENMQVKRLLATLKLVDCGLLLRAKELEEIIGGPRSSKSAASADAKAAKAEASADAASGGARGKSRGKEAKSSASSALKGKGKRSRADADEEDDTALSDSVDDDEDEDGELSNKPSASKAKGGKPAAKKKPRIAKVDAGADMPNEHDLLARIGSLSADTLSTGRGLTVAVVLCCARCRVVHSRGEAAREDAQTAVSADEARQRLPANGHRKLLPRHPLEKMRQL